MQKKKPYTRERRIKLFWSRVEIRGLLDCWAWTASSTCGGYGETTGLNGKKIRTHRFAWELVYGKISEGMFCLHKCDNPPCVNPNHLYIGDYFDNARDKRERFRRRGD